MALITEDGTGKADSESYMSVADADTHFASRGITLWATMLEAEKEQALRRATDYMVEVYRTSWAGYRKTTTQALDWPRYEVPRIDAPQAYGYSFSPSYYDDSSVPAEVKRACAEMAFRAASGELAPDIDRLAKREKVDVIEVEYADGATPYKRYRAIDNMLRPFLGGRPNQIKLVRA